MRKLKIFEARFDILLIVPVLVLTLLAPSNGGRASAQQPIACIKSEFKLALDVGHTPEARGATSARGVPEYVFNLALVATIEKTLRQAGFQRIAVISAHGIGRGQLRNRTKSANMYHPDLLLSIHHDDTQRRYHSRWIFHGTEKEYSDKFSGYSIFVSNENAKLSSSMAFAGFLGSALRKRGLLYSPHHSEDIDGERRTLVDRDLGIYFYGDLFILRLSNAPAVLLEAGVIVNRAEEMVLASPEGKERIAQSVLEAVQEYCAANAAR